MYEFKWPLYMYDLVGLNVFPERTLLLFDQMWCITNWFDLTLNNLSKSYM